MDISTFVRVIASGGLISLLLFLITKVIYNLYFHPLSKFPGPKIYAASSIPSTTTLLKGHIGHKIKTLHARYGPIIRMAPGELVFCSPGALKDIYLRSGSRPPFQKDPIAYGTPPNGIHSILGVRDDATHSRYKRLLSHAFSEKALQEQASLIMRHINLFMDRLQESAPEGSQDMVTWFNYVAFDIIGDLTLGESFDCLQQTSYHPWVSFILTYFKASAFLATAKQYPVLTPLLLWFIPKSLIKGRIQHAMFTKEKVEKRIDSDTTRPDFMSNVLRHNDQGTGMSKEEITATFSILLVAGSETTATLLSAVTFYLLKNSRVMEKLCKEIRTSFEKEEEITQISVNKLKYLFAVLEEGMRMHPPAPRGGPRVVPKSGAMIDGIWVPGGTLVTVAINSAHHYGGNWTDPQLFVPERWLGDPKYAKDNKAAFIPFNVGPRNCIGKNLAYAEMKLIMTKMIWRFDMKLDERSRGWAENMKMYLLWEKPPLFVKLMPVKRD